MGDEETLPGDGRITPADIERARSQIGIPQYERNPVFNRVASSDTISHFAFGIGDDNPLWHDAEYGRTTRWRGQIASPLYATTIGLDDTAFRTVPFAVVKAPPMYTVFAVATIV